MRTRLANLACALICALPVVGVRAQATAVLADQADLTSAGDPRANASPRPLWEAGLFGFAVSQQAYPGAAEHTRRAFGLPFVVYRGRYFRVDDNTVGVRALNTPLAELDIGFAGSFGASSSDVAVRSGMPSLGTLFEFGPRLKLNLPAPLPGTRLRLSLPVRAVLDVSDGFRSRGVSFEPELELGWRLAGGTRLGAKAGLILGDRALNDHLYGVAPAYATASRPAYDGKAGLMAARLSLSSATRLSADWDVFTFARLDTVRGAANADSPLVRKTSGASVGIGLSWTFWRSAQMEAR